MSDNIAGTHLIRELTAVIRELRHEFGKIRHCRSERYKYDHGCHHDRDMDHACLCEAIERLTLAIEKIGDCRSCSKHHGFCHSSAPPYPPYPPYPPFPPYPPYPPYPPHAACPPSPCPSPCQTPVATQQGGNASAQQPTPTSDSGSKTNTGSNTPT